MSGNQRRKEVWRKYAGTSVSTWSSEARTDTVARRWIRCPAVGMTLQTLIFDPENPSGLASSPGLDVGFLY